MQGCCSRIPAAFADHQQKTLTIRQATSICFSLHLEDIFFCGAGEKLLVSMVRLTMTKAMVAALELCNSENKDCPVHRIADEPSLEEPAVGNPISHGQVIQLSKYFKHRSKSRENKNIDARDDTLTFDLDTLLRGSKVYVEPPKPKPEPVKKKLADFILLCS